MTGKEALEYFKTLFECWKEAVKNIVPEIMIENKEDYEFSKNYKQIKQDLERLEKIEKVVEIVKKKRLSLVYFVYEIRADKNKRNYQDYKYWATNKVKSKDDLLTEEEFNLLLKEVFKNE